MFSRPLHPLVVPILSIYEDNKVVRGVWIVTQTAMVQILALLLPSCGLGPVIQPFCVLVLLSVQLG